MKKRLIALFLALCLLFSQALPALAGNTPEEQLSLLRQMEEILRREALEPPRDDLPADDALLQQLREDPAGFDRLMTKLLSGYDSHTMYLPAGSYTQAFSGDTAPYVGVGITFCAHPLGGRVTEVNPFSAAAQAGIRVGDLIVRAEETALRGMTADQIAALLRGDADTAVSVTLLRGEQEITLRLTRQQQIPFSCCGMELEDGIFYLKCNRFSETDGSSVFFRSAVFQAAERKDSLILDLRDNPGGSLDQAFSMVSDLLPERVRFFQTEERNSKTGEPLIRYQVSDGKGASLPQIIILVNENTASAAEVMTASLCDTGYAVSVGTKTFGKARAQYHVLLGDDAAAVFTVSKLIALRQGDYEGVGLTPDVEVQNTLERGADWFRLPEHTPLAQFSCSDNGEALHRALVELGCLSSLPEKPYQITPQTIAALRPLREQFGLADPDFVDLPTLQLVNRLLDAAGQGLYSVDRQLEQAILLARQAAEPLSA